MAVEPFPSSAMMVQAARMVRMLGRLVSGGSARAFAKRPPERGTAAPESAKSAGTVFSNLVLGKQAFA